jgi:hypothetical protein
MYNERIFYYTSDENQFLKLVHEESFEEAQALVKASGKE